MDTIRGVPALADSDPAAAIGQYSRDLRTELNDGRLPFAIATGTVQVTTVVGGQASQNFTLPAGRFAVAPIMLAQVRTTDPSLYEAVARPSSATDALMWVRDNRSSGSPITVTVEWFAIQMMPTAAEG